MIPFGSTPQVPAPRQPADTTPVRLAHTDHLAPMYDLGDDGRLLLCDMLSGWFVTNGAMDRERLMLLVDEAKAVTS